MLVLPAALAADLLAHARAELPNEACGLLAGSTVAGRASAFHAARNALASPYRYDLHPEDLVRIVFAIEDAGDDLVAIFHSHVRSAAVPSATDRRLARYPDAIHLLATLSDPDARPSEALRAWRIRDGASHEVPIVIE